MALHLSPDAYVDDCEGDEDEEEGEEEDAVVGERECGVADAVVGGAVVAVHVWIAGGCCSKPVHDGGRDGEGQGHDQHRRQRPLRLLQRHLALQGAANLRVPATFSTSLFSCVPMWDG